MGTRRDDARTRTRFNEGLALQLLAFQFNTPQHTHTHTLSNPPGRVGLIPGVSLAQAPSWGSVRAEPRPRVNPLTRERAGVQAVKNSHVMHVYQNLCVLKPNLAVFSF